MKSLTISQILLSLSTLTILFMLYYVLKKKTFSAVAKNICNCTSMCINC